MQHFFTFFIFFIKTRFNVFYSWGQRFLHLCFNPGYNPAGGLFSPVTPGIAQTSPEPLANGREKFVPLESVMGKIVFLKIVFYFKIENTILFSIFKLVLNSIL